MFRRILAEKYDAIYMHPERGPIKMSERKSTNPKDILAQDEQRVLLHLIPSPALIETAKALMDGARKYGAYNWREEGVGASTYLSAAMRHLRSYLDGERDAKDSGVHHLGHAMACLAILLDAEAVGNLVDDRPLPAPTAKIMDQLKTMPLAVDRTSGFIPAEDIHVDDRDYLGDYYGESSLSPQEDSEATSQDVMQPAPVKAASEWFERRRRAEPDKFAPGSSLLPLHSHAARQAARMRSGVTQEQSEAAFRARMPRKPLFGSTQQIKRKHLIQGAKPIDPNLPESGGRGGCC
jgi:hypothetical protein